MEAEEEEEAEGAEGAEEAEEATMGAEDPILFLTSRYQQPLKKRLKIFSKYTRSYKSVVVWKRKFTVRLCLQTADPHFVNSFAVRTYSSVHYVL